SAVPCQSHISRPLAPLGNPNGLTTLILAAESLKHAAAFSAYFSPGVSLSGNRITFRPLNSTAWAGTFRAAFQHYAPERKLLLDPHSAGLGDDTINSPMRARARIRATGQRDALTDSVPA